MDQNFIAVQAPTAAMFAGFWQLVWEQDVGIIGKGNVRKEKSLDLSEFFKGHKKS